MKYFGISCLDGKVCDFLYRLMKAYVNRSLSCLINNSKTCSLSKLLPFLNFFSYRFDILNRVH